MDDVLGQLNRSDRFLGQKEFLFRNPRDEVGAKTRWLILKNRIFNKFERFFFFSWLFSSLRLFSSNQGEVGGSFISCVCISGGVN